MARACREAGCALIGGELAEMGDLYRPGDYDVAGFIVGAVERAHVITGAGIRPGDVILALPSVGLHTNGYSLARRIFFDHLGLSCDARVEELQATVADLLLAPHRSYLAPLRDLIGTGKIKGLAHITGGGLTDNVPRILPEGCSARIYPGRIRVLPIFRFLQKSGWVEESEMWRTFNMGVGMVIVTSPPDAAAVEEHLTRLGESPFRIGAIEEGPRRVVYGG
jgi:phosphoribosylformylglycinamidine cyclo-ligase